MCIRYGCGGVPQDYDENDQDIETETYPVDNHPLIDCGADDETERTTLLGQSLLTTARPGKIFLLLLIYVLCLLFKFHLLRP